MFSFFRGVAPILKPVTILHQNLRFSYPNLDLSECRCDKKIAPCKQKYALSSQSEKHILFQAKIVKIYALLRTETSENQNLCDRTHLYHPCKEISFSLGNKSSLDTRFSIMFLNFYF